MQSVSKSWLAGFIVVFWNTPVSPLQQHVPGVSMSIIAVAFPVPLNK